MDATSAGTAVGRVSRAARPGPGLALALGASVLALLAAALAISIASHQVSNGIGGSGLLALAFAAVGTIVARQQPWNATGWSLLGAGAFLEVSNIASVYAVWDYRMRDGSLPFGPAAVLAQPAWAPAIFLLALSILLYPHGRLPSGRWRWPLGLLTVCGSIWLVGAFAIAGTAIANGRIRIEPGGDLWTIDHPTAGWTWWSYTQWAFFGLLLAVGLAWLGSRLPALRRASGEERQQLKWLLCGGTATVVGGVGSVVLSYQGGVLGVAASVATFGILGLPLGLAVGILEYRLYEIDRLISRTLSYTLLTGALLAVFSGLVLLTTRVLPFSSPVGVAASTLAAAALFNPLRGRLQRLVDRRFNRARYDADALVAGFSARLRDAVDPETVRAGLVEAAAVAVEPAYVSVWLREPPS